jgi:peptidoglycan hydrolase FlgJ
MPSSITPSLVSNLTSAVKAPSTPPTAKDPELRKAFDSFVGETFYGQMLKSLRQSQNKPAYFYGGRAEEIFQGQLDQVLAQKLSNTSADKFSGPMFELFSMQRQ